MEFGVSLRSVSVIKLLLILSNRFNIQGRNLYLCDFVKKTNFTFGLYSDIYRPISIKLDKLIVSTKLYI